MAKRIFVSYNFNDREVAKSVKSLIETEQLDGQIVFVENDVSYNGQTAVDWEIEHTMEDCDCALFVLGDNARNSPWLEREAAHAKAKDIPVLTSCLPGMNCKTPELLSDSPQVNFDRSAIASTLNQS